MPLPQIIFDRPLPCRRILRKRRTPPKRPGQRTILHPNHTHIARAPNSTTARHPRGHLDLDLEIHGARARETADANAGYILRDGRADECSRVGAAGRGVDGCGQGPCAVLVDLVECHCDFACGRRGGQARGGARAGGRGDAGFRGALGGLGPLGRGAACCFCAACAAGQGVEEAAGCSGGFFGGFGGGSRGASCGTGAHEFGNGGGGVDGAAALGAAKGRRFAAHFACADDGGVGFGAASRRGAVARCAVLDCGGVRYWKRRRWRWRCVPERPGILTPLAPWISVMTPWACTVAAMAAMKAIE
jgi:hypothetical protein